MIVGIICGSGLSGLADSLQNTITVPYSEIPDFPLSTVSGHQSKMIFGEFVSPDGASPPIRAICLCGRFHPYEGFPMSAVALPVRVMRCLGAKALVVTSASGGLNAGYKVGDVVCMADHFALPCVAGKNPLVGRNDDELGPRFPATSDAYDGTMRAAAMKAANALGFGEFVRDDGTYCMAFGPMYESKAECRFLSQHGDAVGMSTIPEVLAAHHCGMKVLFASLITNMVTMPGDEGKEAANHHEVLEAVAKRSNQFQRLVQTTVLDLSGYLTALPDLPPVNLNVPDRTVKKKKVHGIDLSIFETALKIPLYCFCFAAGLVVMDVVLGIELQSSSRSRK
mmetsp:Transcript_32571/g.74945  ORF Transcript_32571/g.74945 Transcript_32571/m.74945 type:complete len:338 (-) Transcript_32571:54-1067(-)